MGKAPIPTIVGGGIGLVPGIVGQVGQFLFITSVIPPEGTTSDRWRIITSVSPAQLAAETAVGREDTTIGIGSTNSGIAAGLLRPDVILGRNIAVTHGNSGANAGGVFIGNGITSAAGSGTGNIVLAPNGLGGGVTILNGGNFIATAGTVANIQGSSVIIAGNASANTNVVVIGQGANANGNSVVVIGQGAAANSANNVAIGQGVSATAARGLAIGQGHGCPNPDMIKIGFSGQNAGTAGQILIGHNIDPNSVGPNEICMGNHNAGGGGNYTVGIRWGQNQHATGVAVPAWTETHKSALGTDINAGDVTYNLPRATGNAAGAAWIVMATTPGASGAAQQALAEVFRVSPGTATQPRNFQITQDKGLWFANQTDGAGVGAGTLTNAPTAGDPTFWLPVRINGADFFIPCWP
jgi:hypothetical protein